MFTWLSDSTVATSESRRVRSSASTWIATEKDVGFPSAQSTSMIRSGSRRCRVRRFGHVSRWTETPWPRETNPTIASPGTGVQHRPSLTHTSPSPRTTTPFEMSGFPILTGRASGTSVTSSSGVPETSRDIRATIDCGETWPSPTAT